LHGTASFDVFCVKIRAGVLAVDDLKNPFYMETYAIETYLSLIRDWYSLSSAVQLMNCLCAWSSKSISCPSFRNMHPMKYLNSHDADFPMGYWYDKLRGLQ